MKGMMVGRSFKGKGTKGSKVVALLLALMVVFSLAGCGKKEAANPAASASGKEVKPVELKLAHFFPANHPVETQLVQPWAEAVEEATKGQVKVTSYPGETLCKAADVYGGVKNGIADIGISCFSYTRGTFPVSEVFELPGITYNNSKVASCVAWEGIQQLNPKEVQDTHLMMLLTTGPGDLYTKTPVTKLADLKGMAIRATGLSASTLKALGANPVALPQSEAYEALSKGLVKGNLGPVEVLQGWKQAEVTKYITKTPFLYNTVFFFTMNQAKWDSLSPENQKAITEVNKKFFNDVAAGIWDKQNQTAMEGAVKQNKMQVLSLTPAETQKWVKLITPIQDDYVKRMKEQNLDGKKALDLVKSLADKYNQQYK